TPGCQGAGGHFRHPWRIPPGFQGFHPFRPAGSGGFHPGVPGGSGGFRFLNRTCRQGNLDSEGPPLVGAGLDLFTVLPGSTCANVPVRTGLRVARFCPGRTGRMRLVPESVSTSPRTRSTQVSPARPEIQRLTVSWKAPALFGDTPTRGYRRYLGTSAFPPSRSSPPLLSRFSFRPASPSVLRSGPVWGGSRRTAPASPDARGFSFRRGRHVASNRCAPP